MAFRSSYYANNLNRDLTETEGLPVISQELDSVRSYQWEVTFFPPQGVETPSTFSKPLTLAAKRVGGFGYTMQDITVDRVNDKVYYPGKIQQDELEVQFDNLLATKTGFQLYKYMTSVWDPETGEYASSFLQNPGQFKSKCEIIELNGRNEVVQVIKLKGVYPKQITKAEKVYSTNDMDTVTMKFRWDFMTIEGDPTA